MSTQNAASASEFHVSIQSKAIDNHQMVTCTVTQDMGQPDMCAITLRNEDHSFSDLYQPGDAVQITAGSEKKVVFTGDVVAMHPEYKSNGRNVIIVRAFNKLHALTRGRKSITYVGVSDEDIVGRIAGRNSMAPSCGELASSPAHDHVYQRNQTDLEFLRTRAERIGYSVWLDSSDGKTLHFNAPNASEDSGLKLRYGDAETAVGKEAVFLKRFSPRLSSANVLEEVEVRGWDPVKKEEIIAVAPKGGQRFSALGTGVARSMPRHEQPQTAEAETDQAGGDSGKKSSGSMDKKKLKSFTVDHPIYSTEEAQKLADAKLAQASLSYMTGEGECRGTPELRPGTVIEIIVNPDRPQDRFNGKYLVVGATHKYSADKTGDESGYVTSFRVCRDAEGGEAGSDKGKSS